MHPKNSFITLTYGDEHLKSPLLLYSDFQKFVKKLRHKQADPIGVFVTGEYGEINKRPHWHAILFNYDFPDLKPLRTNERGDRLFTSGTLNELWPQGLSEIGSVTFESAGYVARYAAKKLCHGKDSEHGYHPVSKNSSKHAIGKKWLEKYWPTVVHHAECRIETSNGIVTVGVPRYYERWLLKNCPDSWPSYVTRKYEKIERAYARAEKEASEHIANRHRRSALCKGLPEQLTRNQRRNIILVSKFEQLMKQLKL
jgi:hypothetical protein